MYICMSVCVYTHTICKHTYVIKTCIHTSSWPRDFHSMHRACRAYGAAPIEVMDSELSIASTICMYVCMYVCMYGACRAYGAAPIEVMGSRLRANQSTHTHAYIRIYIHTYIHTYIPDMHVCSAASASARSCPS